MEFQEEDKIILKSIKIHPNPTELEQLNELILLVKDWDYLINTIIDRGIAPLLYKKLPLLTNSSKIPEFVKTKLQQTYYKTFSRSAFLYEHFKRIAEVFREQKIPVIGLKGIYLSEWLYQDIGMRQFSDIDLLVKEEDAEKSLCILEGLGYKIEESIHFSKFVESQCEIYQYTPRIKNGVSIEIHIKIHSRYENYNVEVSELWRNAIPANVNGIKIYALGNNDLLIHLCLHLDKHFRGGKVQFTCFNDITNFLERYANTLDWNSFIESCKLYNCEDIVFKYIVMVYKFIHANVPTDIIKKYNSLLKKNDEKSFYSYLKGEINFSSSVLSYLNTLKSFKNIQDIAKYFLGILFPPKTFMVKRYKIKEPTSVFFYYPFRFYIGLKGVIKHLNKH